MGLDPLEQSGHSLGSVPGVRIFDVSSIAEQCVGLIEEKHPTLGLGLDEQSGKVRLGLVDVFETTLDRPTRYTSRSEALR